jgi:hypothetical protein
MYTPGQGILLAFGQVFVANPYAGVVLGTCFMCAVLVWAVQAWVPPQWAVLSGVFVILRFAIFSYWMNSYFGGALAATGGALLFGVLARFRKESTGVTVPTQVREISDGLKYRDFVTVGLLAKRLAVEDQDRPKQLIKDNWIYIQEPEVRAGRLQIFNNWSPFMVKDPDTVWVGVEYFCNETDDLWTMPEAEMASLAESELATIGILRQDDVLDATVIRIPKTYPAYFGTYTRFDELREYLDYFENLFLVGRNGMHKYNNQDHSMLTAMTAVDNIAAGITGKSNIWAVNTEMEYHEEKQEAKVTTWEPGGSQEAYVGSLRSN